MCVKNDNLLDKCKLFFFDFFENGIMGNDIFWLRKMVFVYVNDVDRKFKFFWYEGFCKVFSE